MKKGLGRNFDSLIPTDLLVDDFNMSIDDKKHGSKLQSIEIDKIIADPGQPRRAFDEEALRELADSIKEHGIVQPIVVTPSDDKFIIVAGERRWRAAKLINLSKVPCIVRTLTAQHKLEISLIENLQRRDLNAIETAAAYMKLRDQFNLTLEQIGQRVGGKSVSSISNTLRLLRLSKKIQQALLEGKISEGQARPLVGLPEEVAEEIAEKIIASDWSVRKVEQAISLWKQAQKTPSKDKFIRENPHVESAQKLSKRLSSKIKIHTNTKGAGRIVIPFKNQADFERIRDLISQ